MKKKKYTCDDLTIALNQLSVSDDSKKAIAKTLRRRNAPTILSKLGIVLGILMFISWFGNISDYANGGTARFEFIAGPIFGLWFITASASALREIATAKALAEILMETEASQPSEVVR